MSIVTTISSKIEGIKAVKILIETEVTPGIGIHLVGLADAAAKESLLRTVTALQSNGFHIPGRKIVINLAPADLPKKGTGYDLAIALSIIAASGQASLPDLDKYLILGEIGLDGSIRPVTGTAPALVLAKELKLKGCIIPRRNMQEAMLFSEGLDVYAVETLKEAIDITSGDTSSVKTIHEEIDDFEEQGVIVEGDDVKFFLPSNLDEAAEEIASDIAPTHPDIGWDACFEKIKEGIRSGAEWMAGQGVSMLGRIGIYGVDVESITKELREAGFNLGEEIILQIRKKQ